MSECICDKYDEIAGYIVDWGPCPVHSETARNERKVTDPNEQPMPMKNNYPVCFDFLRDWMSAADSRARFLALYEQKNPKPIYILCESAGDKTEDSPTRHYAFDQSVAEAWKASSIQRNYFIADKLMIDMSDAIDELSVSDVHLLSLMQSASTEEDLEQCCSKLSTNARKLGAKISLRRLQDFKDK